MHHPSQEGIQSQMQQGRLRTQPALVYARGKEQALMPAPTGLPGVDNHEVLRAFFPLQDRGFSSIRKIVHSALSPLQ